jgi:putative oxidoreductase
MIRKMKVYQDIATLFLRLSLASGFLSAVASRLGLWGRHSSGWNNFISYAAEVNSFAPKNLIPAIAVVSTILETAFGVLLFVGYKTNLAAMGAAMLSFLFAAAMTWSFGIKEPFDYSVFAVSAGAFLLATMPHYRWSIDELITR